jgi:hypothetical protein
MNTRFPRRLGALGALGFTLFAGVLQGATASAPAAALQPYLGNYPLAPSFVMTVTAEGEKLFLQATNQPRLELRHTATDRYSVVGVAAEVSFERDATGGVAALVLHQDGKHRRAPHLPPGEMPAAPKEIALPANQLAEYVGRYQLGPVTFGVTLQSAQLWVQLTGQERLPVFASARDEFFWKVVDARLSFLRDRQGKVAALVLHQNGTDQRASRLP